MGCKISDSINNTIIIIIAVINCREKTQNKEPLISSLWTIRYRLKDKRWTGERGIGVQAITDRKKLTLAVLYQWQLTDSACITRDFFFFGCFVFCFIPFGKWMRKEMGVIKGQVESLNLGQTGTWKEKAAGPQRHLRRQEEEPSRIK